MMVDGCLEQPFFSRDVQGQVLGSSAHSAWQESKGSFVIEDYHRKMAVTRVADEQELDK